MKTLNKNKIKKVDIDKLGIFIKVILLDHSPSNTKELATLISSTFNCNCTVRDIHKYEQLYEYNQKIEIEQITGEDYELESRRQQFNLLE